jgi:glutaredoxin
MKKKIKLYSTGCPQCNVLKSLLDGKGIDYAIVDDITFLLNKGIAHVPMLEVDDELLNMSQAIKWVNGVCNERK